MGHLAVFGGRKGVRPVDADIRSRAESILGRSFDDETLLELALVHASVADRRVESNERLEFLGDSVLGLVASHRIYELFPTLLEGEMTKIKSTAVSRRTCAELAHDLGLPDLLVIGKGMQHHHQLPTSLAAAVFESVIGAVYLDGGFDAAFKFLCPLLDPLIKDAAECGHQENFKSVLQQHAQQLLEQTPSYRVLDEKGPDHAKCFKVCVELNGKRYEASWGPSKKRAEQQAALNALRELGVVQEDDDGAIRVISEVSENGQSV